MQQNAPLLIRRSPAFNQGSDSHEPLYCQAQSTVTYLFCTKHYSHTYGSLHLGSFDTSKAMNGPLRAFLKITINTDSGIKEVQTVPEL